MEEGKEDNKTLYFILFFIVYTNAMPYDDVPFHAVFLQTLILCFA
jgi:hypothetical protein